VDDDMMMMKKTTRPPAAWPRGLIHATAWGTGKIIGC
jgi:hypothetical protein